MHIQRSSVPSTTIPPLRTVTGPEGSEWRLGQLLTDALQGQKPTSSYAELEATQLVGILRQLPVRASEQLQRHRIAPILLADLDGTFIRDASGGFVADEYIRQGLVDPALLPALKRIMTLFEVPCTEQDPSNAAQLLVHTYEEWVKTKKSSDPKAMEKTREVYAFLAYLYAGRTAQWVRHFAHEYMQATGFFGQVFAESKPLIDALKSHGIRTALISASPDPIAKVLGTHLGIADELVHGVPIANDARGVYLPSLSGPLPFREGKVEHGRAIMREVFGDETLTPLLAIGDTPSKTDEHLLHMPLVTLVAEPQTAKDYAKARTMSQEGRAVVVVDFRSTVAGEPANRFDLRGAAYQDTQLRVM